MITLHGIEGLISTMTEEDVYARLSKVAMRVLHETLASTAEFTRLGLHFEECENHREQLSAELRNRLHQAKCAMDTCYANLNTRIRNQLYRVCKARKPELQFDWSEAADSQFPTEKLNVKNAPPKPQSVREAMNGRFKKYFMRAMLVEMESIMAYEVFELERLPKGRKAVNSKWVFDYKTDPHGFIERFKARLVAVGSSQIEGQDYNETHSPVVKIKVIRILLALSAMFDLKVEQIDINTAFLNGTLDETNYMRLPQGFRQNDAEGYPLYAKLKKSLYGLHQAGREWYKTLRAYLLEIGFTELKSDVCTFLKFDDDSGQLIILVVYVDDILIASGNPDAIIKVKTLIQAKFGIKDLGEAKWILKIQVKRFEDGVWIGQTNYIEKILREHGIWELPESKWKDTPMVVNWRHDSSDVPVDNDQNSQFTRVIAELLYLGQMSRPDILFAVNTLAQYQRGKALKCDFVAAFHVLRYLRKTVDLGLFYSPKKSSQIVIFESSTEEKFLKKTGELMYPEGLEPKCYTDASYAQEYDRKSRSGYIFFVFGCPVIWYSKKQSVTALSSTEAELYALVEGIKEASWMRSFLAELGFNHNKPMVLEQDNQSVIAIAANPIHHARIKHMEVKTYFVRENVENGLIKLVYCPTEMMLADILTKALGKRDHNRLISLMGMRMLSELEQSGLKGDTSLSQKSFKVMFK